MPQLCSEQDDSYADFVEVDPTGRYGRVIVSLFSLNLSSLSCVGICANGVFLAFDSIRRFLGKVLLKRCILFFIMFLNVLIHATFV